MYAVCRAAHAAHQNRLAHVRFAHDALWQIQQRLELILVPAAQRLDVVLCAHLLCRHINRPSLAEKSIHIATPVFALANADEWSALLFPCNFGVSRQTVVILPVSVSLSLSMLYILCAARHATSARMPSRRRVAHIVLTTASSVPAMPTSQSTQ